MERGRGGKTAKNSLELIIGRGLYWEGKKVSEGLEGVNKKREGTAVGRRKEDLTSWGRMRNSWGRFLVVLEGGR